MCVTAVVAVRVSTRSSLCHDVHVQRSRGAVFFFFRLVWIVLGLSWLCFGFLCSFPFCVGGGGGRGIVSVSAGFDLDVCCCCWCWFVSFRYSVLRKVT